MEEKSVNPNKRKKIVYDIIIALLSVILILALCYTVKYFVIDRNKVFDNAEELKSLIVDDDYSDLLRINPGFAGWLTITGTRVDLPVTKYSDNTFYLRHNFYKDYDFRGCPFVDCRYEVTKNANNLVIYGHNCHDGTIFSDVVNFIDIEYYKEHPVVEYNTPEKRGKYKICAVFVTNATASEDRGYVFPFNYPDMTGINAEGYINELLKRTLYYTDVDINENDNFLTLQTCIGRTDNVFENFTYPKADTRLVLVAREIREGEDESVNVDMAYKNEKPKFPQIFYKHNNLQNPYKNDEQWHAKEVITNG